MDGVVAMVVGFVEDVVLDVGGGYVTDLDDFPSFLEGLRRSGLDVNLSGGLLTGVVRCDDESVCEDKEPAGSDD